jgi:uncharacterized protein
MICPVCKSDMIVVEYKNIELDHCLNCGGVWFDAGELALMTQLLKVPGNGLCLEEIIKLPEAASSEKRHHCPICGHRMKKTIICKEPEIIIDVCDRGDGLWFDGGELAQLLKQVVKSSGEAYGEWQEVFSFLGEVFHAQE